MSDVGTSLMLVRDYLREWIDVEFERDSALRRWEVVLCAKDPDGNTVPLAVASIDQGDLLTKPRHEVARDVVRQWTEAAHTG